MLDVDQAGELKAGFRRHGWTNALIKKLSEGDNLAKVRDVLLGRAEIKMIEHTIDCDAPVFLPNGWGELPDTEQLPNRVRGLVKFDPTKAKLHLVSEQKDSKCIGGNDLRKQLANQPVYTAHILDYVLKPENQHLIPEEYKGKEVFFWGTIYRGPDGNLYVRYLFWSGVGWNWRSRWLGYGWDVSDPAAVSAS